MPARTIYLIKRLETEVTANMIKILGAYDITPSQFIILNFVGDNETDLSSAQLSRRFLMTPQSMNEVVTTLQRKELLERNTDPNHKRILRITLTEKGKEVLEICNAAMDVFEEKLLKKLKIKEKEVFRGSIGKILENLKEEGEEKPKVVK
ncbi:MAG: MarR family transcriptional regulator [Haliscomenobacter sp.]|uniref:MarR family winged helix-turn-helix transcriptional regulator n=1 Tax=Haliscomenobacter sp. TaxID=2717303 RepID=UPI0029B56DE1|nr:MarR family transcriptional regulator [Haliscomenobacter sp.]MDX2069270.1 MarR family transcriptional regulator [Haliscomenobacter sp.]